MTALKASDKDLIKSYLSQQRDLSDEDIEGKYLDDIIEKASRFYHDFVRTKKHEIEFSHKDISFIKQFIEVLQRPLLAEEIHSSVYEIAHHNNIKPQYLFKVLYRALIEQDRGPRLGNFITMIGREKAIEIMSTALGLQREEEKDSQAWLYAITSLC